MAAQAKGRTSGYGDYWRLHRHPGPRHVAQGSWGVVETRVSANAAPAVGVCVRRMASDACPCPCTGPEKRPDRVGSARDRGIVKVKRCQLAHPLSPASILAWPVWYLRVHRMQTCFASGIIYQVHSQPRRQRACRGRLHMGSGAAAPRTPACNVLHGHGWHACRRGKRIKGDMHHTRRRRTSTDGRAQSAT